MFGFLKGITCAPQIAVGGGIKTIGNGMIAAGEVVAGTGASLQANGWIRRLAINGVKVIAVNNHGKDLGLDQHSALMRHFCNPTDGYVKFVALDADDANAIQKAADYQAEFNQRSGQPVAQPTQTEQPKLQEPVEESLTEALSKLSDDELGAVC